MGSLASALGDVKIRRQRCTVAVLLESLDNDDCQTLQAWLDDPLIPSTKIVEALRREGHPVSAWPFQRHRRGQCMCGVA